MTFEVGRLFEIDRQSADHRASAARFQSTSPDDLPIPQLAWRYNQSADPRPMPGRCPQITGRCFYHWKNREGVRYILTWADGAPIADRRRKWPADTLDNPQIIARKCHFSPQNPSDRRRSLLCDIGLTNVTLSKVVMHSKLSVSLPTITSFSTSQENCGRGKTWNGNSSRPSVKILLTLYTERYTTYFDTGRKLRHYCIWNHCIADTH